MGQTKLSFPHLFVLNYNNKNLTNVGIHTSFFNSQTKYKKQKPRSGPVMGSIVSDFVLVIMPFESIKVVIDKIEY